MITVDGIDYDVRVKFDSLQRVFEIMEGQNKGISLNGKTIRDIVGTAYAYTMEVEPNPANIEDYDSFYEVITAPTDYHTVSLPYGQTTIEFDAAIQSGQDFLARRPFRKTLERSKRNIHTHPTSKDVIK